MSACSVSSARRPQSFHNRNSRRIGWMRKEVHTMNSSRPMDTGRKPGSDPGAVPFTASLSRLARQNADFRRVIWTGKRLQLTVMDIPPCGEIGLEIHPETDQMLRVEAGRAIVRMGASREALDFQRSISEGDAIWIPCGVWHNVTNAGSCHLKLSSLYAPPQHPRGAVHHTQADAEKAES